MSTGISSQQATVDYLQLFTAQLKNQDPLDPAEQEGLINDLAQFSELEGIENMNDSFSELLKLQELTQGMGMVGKNVEYTDSQTGEIKTGTVTEMFPEKGNVRVMVDGDTVSLGDISRIMNS